MAPTSRATPGSAAFWLLVLLLLASLGRTGSAQVAPTREAERLYALRGDSLLWHEDARFTSAGRSAIRLLLAAGDHGLDPAEFDAFRLDSLARAAGTAMERRRLDLLITVDLLRYLERVRGGRAPGEPREDIAAALREAIAADAVPALAAALEPGLAQYRYLRRALAEYRRLAALPTPGPLPHGRTIHPGEPYEGAEQLREMLVALGDSPPGDIPVPAPVYDSMLAAAVVRFQERHGLAEDGILGRHTLAALNVPLPWRVRQLELALERLRRLPSFEGERLIVVNVPAFRLFAIDSAATHGIPALTSRVVVGRALDTRTPALFEEMRHVEFWPWWNVPRSIVVKEILPALRRRPDYLRRNDMELVGPNGRSLGDVVTPAVLDRLARGALRVRQRPGPGNALGAVKFVFPNEADVYIHGTPNLELFERTRRDFSHGCIRAEAFARLATWVLGGQGAWNTDSTEAAIAAGMNRRIALARPFPVAVYYTTAVAAPGGRVFFWEDLYGLDRPLDAELRAAAYLP